MRLRRAALAVLLVLGGCASALTPTGAPSFPGETPRLAWLPETGRPRARVLAVHGFNDYGRAFEGFGAYAAARGVAVHAYDQPGFGARPDAGSWPGAEALTAALRAEAARLRAEDPETPLYLLGESMGGAVAMIAVTGPRPPDVDGVVLSAPAVWGDGELGPLPRLLLWLAVRAAPAWTLTGENLDILPTDNIEALRRLSRDPLVIKATRIDAIAGVVATMDAAVEAAPRMPGPLLALSGEKDEVVPPAANAVTRARLTARPCLAVAYPDGYHMLLRDLQRRRVWDDVLAWIDRKTPPSGLAQACGDDVRPRVTARLVP